MVGSNPRRCSGANVAKRRPSTPFSRVPLLRNLLISVEVVPRDRPAITAISFWDIACPATIR